MPSRREIYLAKATMCEHLAKAAGDDNETKLRALRLEQQWRDLAGEAERAEQRPGIFMRWAWLAAFLKSKGPPSAPH